MEEEPPPLSRSQGSGPPVLPFILQGPRILLALRGPTVDPTQTKLAASCCSSRLGSQLMGGRAATFPISLISLLLTHWSQGHPSGRGCEWPVSNQGPAVTRVLSPGLSPG